MKIFIQINFTKGLSKNGRSLEIYTLKNKHNDKVYIDNLIIIEFNIDKIKEMWYSGNKELAFIAALDADNEELDKMCKGDEYMELFEKEVRRLNKNQKFTEFMTPEEENEKLIKTLASEAKTEGIKIGQNLIKQGVTLDIIMNATGLSKKELEALHTN